ncbi:cytochrome P450 family, partial [Rhizoctonia solani]
MTNTQLSGSILPISLAALFFYQCWRLIRRPNIRHPPSPASLPLVGNLFSIPSGQECVAFAEIGEKLKSDIVYLELFGQKIVVLNSAEAASDLLDKRSGIYSDRPSIPMVTDPSLMNWTNSVSLAKYGELTRSYRRIMNNWLNKRAVVQFNPMQERQARLLLKSLLNVTNRSEPFQAVKKELFFSAGSSMLQVAYGYESQGPDDPFFTMAKLAFEHALHAGMQTNFLVNVFPAMLHIPDWFPGTGWKRIGRQWGIMQEEAKTRLYEWVKEQVASETHQVSLLGLMLQDAGHALLSGLSPTETEERLKEVGIIFFGATMVLHPDVQLRAQQELDTILGQVTLPTIKDQERLPYIRNVVEEVLRMYPVVPLGLPHVCFKDDIYRGYHIEKETIVMGNVWAISRNPHVYKNPEEFNPDRYLDPSVLRPPVFGWGRRYAFYSEMSLKLCLTGNIYKLLQFSKKKNNDGKEIMPQIKPKRNSLIVELDYFEFKFKPRSEEHRQFILRTNFDKEQVPIR